MKTFKSKLTQRKDRKDKKISKKNRNSVILKSKFKSKSKSKNHLSKKNKSKYRKNQKGGVAFTTEWLDRNYGNVDKLRLVNVLIDLFNQRINTDMEDNEDNEDSVVDDIYLEDNELIIFANFLRKNKTIKELDLSESSLKIGTDSPYVDLFRRVFMDLPDSPGNKTITSLDMRFNHTIYFEDFEELCNMMENNESIRELHFEDCEYISGAFGYRELSASAYNPIDIGCLEKLLSGKNKLEELYLGLSKDYRERHSYFPGLLNIDNLITIFNKNKPKLKSIGFRGFGVSPISVYQLALLEVCHDVESYITPKDLFDNLYFEKLNDEEIIKDESGEEWDLKQLMVDTLKEKIRVSSDIEHGGVSMNRVTGFSKIITDLICNDLNLNLKKDLTKKFVFTDKYWKYIDVLLTNCNIKDSVVRLMYIRYLQSRSGLRKFPTLKALYTLTHNDISTTSGVQNLSNLLFSGGEKKKQFKESYNRIHLELNPREPLPIFPNTGCIGPGCVVSG